MTVDEAIATKEQIEMIEEFQCPGCTCGYKTGDCNQFKFQDWGDSGCQCVGHSAGTMMFPGDKIALGLPTGFNKVGAIKTGFEREDDETRRSTNIRLIVDPKDKCEYDKLNVPVWAMEKDGYLFVRVYCPRINYSFVDVIQGGKFDDICPDAMNVAEFIDEID